MPTTTAEKFAAMKSVLEDIYRSDLRSDGVWERVKKTSDDQWCYLPWQLYERVQAIVELQPKGGQQG